MVREFPVTVNVLTSKEAGKSSKEKKAINIIANMLLNGKRYSEEILNKCEDEGISERTVNSAKKKLPVRAIRVGSKWYWEFMPQS